MLMKLAILALLVAARNVGAQIPGHGRNQENKAQQERQSGSPLLPSLVIQKGDGDQQTQYPQQQPSIWEQAVGPTTWSNWALVAVGAAASFFAWRTLKAISRQASSLDRQIKAERDSFIQSQRPRITARTFYFKCSSGTLVLGEGNNLGFDGQFYIANTGGTTAHVKEVFCMCSVLKSLPAQRPWEGKTGCKVNLTIPPGLSWPYPFTTKPEVIDSAIWGQMVSAYKHLYVMGWVDYQDEAGLRRTTRFCRRYSTSEGRFRPVENDPDYESQD